MLLSLSGTFLPALEVSSECLLTGLGLGGTAAASSAILITTGTRRTVFCSVARFTTVEAQAGTGTRGPLHSGGGGGGVEGNDECYLGPVLHVVEATENRKPSPGKSRKSNKRHNRDLEMLL